MNTHANKTQKNKAQAVANTIVQKKENLQGFQLDDNRPETIIQQKIKTAQLQGKHSKGCGCSSCASQLMEKKNSEIIQKQSKKTAQLKPCKHGNNKSKCKACQQSIDARNVNRLNQYQTPAKGRKQEEREEAVKGRRGVIAHGSGGRGSSQSGKMGTILEDVNKKGKKGKKG